MLFRSYLFDVAIPSTLKVPTGLTILDYIGMYKLNAGPATVTWEFNTLAEGCTIEARYDVEGKLLDTKLLSGSFQGMQSDNVVKVKATVVNQYGHTTQVAQFGKTGVVEYEDLQLKSGVTVIYNGTTYVGDSHAYPAVTVHVAVGDTITLTSTSGEYGRFAQRNNGEKELARTTAMNGQVQYTVKGTEGTWIYFLSDTPVAVTPETGIQSGKINNVSGNVSITADATNGISIDEDTTINLEAGSVLTINKNTASGSARSAISVNKNAKLTITGAGTIQLPAEDRTNDLIAVEGGTVEVGEATLQGRSYYGISVYTPNVASTVILNGTTIKSDYGVFLNGGNDKANVFTLNDVTIDTKGACLYLAGKGTTTIQGGSFTANTEDAAIEVRAGTLSLLNAEVTCKTSTYSVTSNGDGSTTHGAALAVVPHTTYNPVNVTVDGGTYTGVMAVSVANPERSTGACTVTVNATLRSLSNSNGSYSVTVPNGVTTRPNVSINGVQVSATEIGAPVQTPPVVES